MADSGVRIQAMLDGYAKFLREKDLALPKHQPYLVRWVREFLLFAQGHGGYTFEQTLDMFLAAIAKRGDVKPWQIQQAADAARIYRYQYRGAKDDGRGIRKGVSIRQDVSKGLDIITDIVSFFSFRSWRAKKE
jgi:hypothetical protein